MFNKQNEEPGQEWVSDTSPIELLTIMEVTELLKVSVSAVRRLQGARRIPFIKVGGSVRFLKSDILEYVRKNRIEAIQLSIGTQLGPRIGIQKGPPLPTFRTISARPVGAGRGCGDGASAGCSVIVVSAFETPAVIAGFDDVAVVGQAIEQRGGHLCIAEHAGPFAEGEIRGDDD